MLQVWNVSLIVATFSLSLLGTFLVRSGVLESIHAFGDSKVGPPLLALIAAVLLGSTALIVSPPPAPSLRAAHRLAALPRSDLPRQQSAARRHRRGHLLGHLLPADRRGVHRRDLVAGGALVRPLHDAAGDPAGAVYGRRAAARLAARELARALAGTSPCRSRSRRRRLARLIAFTRRGRAALGAGHSSSLAAFTLALWPASSCAQPRARQALLRRVASRRRWSTTISRNRRRYGGYTVHAWFAILLVAVAASSSFQTCADLRLRPG